MRKLVALGSLAFALAFGAPSALLAATPASTGSPAIAPAAVTHHVWAASVPTGTLHGASRIVLTSTYSSGVLHVTADGVKKGDILHVRVTAKTSKGKTLTIVAFSHTVTSVKSGVTRFTMTLSLTRAHMIRADVKAKDTLTFHLKDGTLSISAPYVKKS